MKLGDLRIHCSDVDRSVAFYRDGLGFELLEHADDGAILSSDGRRIVLRPISPGGPGVTSPMVVLDVVAEHPDAEIARLWAAGIEFEGNRLPCDPDGLVLRIVGPEQGEERAREAEDGDAFGEIEDGGDADADSVTSAEGDTGLDAIACTVVQAVPEPAPAAVVDEARGHERFDVSHELRIESRRGPIAAQSVNVSRTGILVQLPAGAPGRTLAEFAQQVDDLFGETMLLAVPDLGMKFRAAIVRVDHDDGRWFVGSRFETPLTRYQCRELGVPAG